MKHSAAERQPMFDELQLVASNPSNSLCRPTYSNISPNPGNIIHRLRRLHRFFVRTVDVVPFFQSSLCNRRNWWIFLVLLVTANANGQTSPSQSDTQQWTDVQLAVPVTQEIDFNLLGTLRFGRNLSHSVDERVGVGMSVKLGKYFTFTPNYVHIGMQPFAGRKVWENRISLPVTLRFDVGKFKLSDRNTIERRYRTQAVAATRYRNRFQVDHPIAPGGLKLTLFVADEVFYDWSVDDWVRNRFTIGVTRVYNKHFTQDYYYMRQNDGRSVPGDLNVIGTSLRFRL
jgi:hypothetical protein